MTRIFSIIALFTLVVLGACQSGGGSVDDTTGATWVQTTHYEQEKHLFEANAKATIDGSDGYVRAIAYDDDTDELHVGTLAGRSVFRGLNRVDSTTDSISKVISASNGLVIEE